MSDSSSTLFPGSKGETVPISSFTFVDIGLLSEPSQSNAGNFPFLDWISYKLISALVQHLASNLFPSLSDSNGMSMSSVFQTHVF